MRHRALACAVLLGLACGRARSADGGAEVTQLGVDSTPALDLTGTLPNGDVTFTYPSGATRLSTGAIAVGDLYGEAVWFFDAAGQPTAKIGRAGRGPGEFSRVAWIGQCRADSVFAWDASASRMTVLSAQGAVIRQYRLPADPGASTPPSVVACSRAGGFAYLGVPENPQINLKTGESPYDRGPLYLGDAAGGVRRVVESVGYGEMRPLGKITSLALSADAIFVGTKDSAFVDVYGYDGQHRAAVPVGGAPRRPTQRNYEAAIAAQAATLRSADDRKQIRGIMLGMPMPEFLPAYGALFTDPDGVLWVTLSAAGDSVTRLRAVHRTPPVELTISRDLRVFEVGRDYVLGAYEDEAGEPHVVLYTMRHRPAAPGT
jgi:hypothetical protein